MISQPFYRPEPLDHQFLEDESLQEQRIELSPDQIRWAAQISEPVCHTKRRWQIYLNALALVGFKQWLTEWAADLTVNDSGCSILHPQYINLLEAVCNLRVESFTLCLIAVDSSIDISIDIPKAIVELPQFTPHFYVLVNILEEQGQVQIQGYLRHDQLVHLQSTQPLQAGSDWTYELPLEWFTLDSNVLLLELRYLEAAAISLAVSPPNLVSVDQLKMRLAEIQAQLCSSKQLPEQLLTWTEGATLLTYPALIDTYLLSPAPAPLQAIVQQAINAGLWLHDRLDGLAQTLAWSLLPGFDSPIPAFRSVEQTFDEVRSSLELQGLVIPNEARGAYHDLETELRLYAVVWAMDASELASEVSSEWVLLLALTTPSNVLMPIGTSLRVRDAENLLSERVVTDSIEDSFLCTQVAGGWDEQFWVTIELPNGNSISLPPLAFHPAELP